MNSFKIVNWMKTGLLMAGLTVLLVLLGRAIGGPTGMIIAFGFALLTNFDTVSLVATGAFAGPTAQYSTPLPSRRRIPIEPCGAFASE